MVATMNTRNAFFGLVLAGLVAPACASDLAALWAYAKAAEGKFAVELGQAQPTMRVRAEFDRGDLIGFVYDAARQELRKEHPSPIQSLRVAEDCRGTGSYTGNTTAGRSVKVLKRACTRLFVNDTGDGLPIGSDACHEASGASAGASPCELRSRRLTATVTPDQYRALKRGGIWIELEFSPATGATKEVATTETVVHPPTWSDPTEARITVWNVFGKVVRARMTDRTGTIDLGTFTADGQ